MSENKETRLERRPEVAEAKQVATPAPSETPVSNEKPVEAKVNSTESKQDDVKPAEVKQVKTEKEEPVVPVVHERPHQTKEEKKRLHRIRSFKDWAMFTGYLTPSFVGVLLFFFLPLLLILKTSFQRSSTNTDFVGIQNYERVLTNDAFIAASKNTMTFAALAVPLAVIIALLLALLLNSGLPGKSIFRSILLNPMMVPVASVVLIWQVFFSFNGVMNGWGFYKLFEDHMIDWLKSDYAQLVILFLFLWKNMGYNMVLFLSALGNIPEEIIEAASLDGANALKRFFSIKMHYLASTIFFVAIMSLINSFKIFREVYLLTGDYPYDTLYMLQHYMNNAFKNLDYSKLSAGAMIMCVVMIVIVGVLFFTEAKVDSDVEG